MVVLSRSRAFLRYLSRYSQKKYKEGVRAIQIRATKYKKIYAAGKYTRTRALHESNIRVERSMKY